MTEALEAMDMMNNAIVLQNEVMLEALATGRLMLSLYVTIP